MRRYLDLIKENPVWLKVILFDFTLFLIWVADGIIAFWAPVQIQNKLNNPVVMGLIISCQSIAGLTADIVFPQILKNVTAKRLVYFGIISVGITSLLLVASDFRPFLIIFLLTMVIWGIYYEFIGFAFYQFIGSSVPRNMHSSASGISSVFSSSAYFFGPLIAPFLIAKGSILTETVILLFLFAAFSILSFTQHNQKITEKVEFKEANPIKEIKHWVVLAKIIWPMIVLSMILGL